MLTTLTFNAANGLSSRHIRSPFSPKAAIRNVKGGLRQGQRPPFAPRLTAFRKPVCRLLHGISRPADPLPDTKHWPASTYTHAEKPPVRTGTQIFSKKTVHKIHALTLPPTIRLTSLKSHGCYRTNRHQTAGKTVKMHTSAQCAHFWAQQF